MRAFLLLACLLSLELAAAPDKLVGAAAAAPAVIVLHDITGPMKTNAYLLYDPATREAALIDVGGPIDALLAVIEQRGLQVRYLFTTHAHVDHVQGLPAVRARFPRAQWCLARPEFEATAFYAQWEQVMAPEEAARIKAGMAADAALAETMSFDFARLGKPDVFVEDGQTFPLGRLTLRALASPGHSSGSVCYSTAGVLFAGDVLFHRRIGRWDLPKAGGRAVLETSVRRLYQQLPDETLVYPGHGPSTEIGIEKTQNQQVKLEPAKT